MEYDFSPEDTRRLLDAQTRPEHVIITALAHSLSRWTSSRTVLIDVLSHGRDAAFDGVNLSRTVRFTLSYNPLVLSHPAWDRSLGTLDAVTEQIDGGPEGFSFELLRFLASDQDLRDRMDQQSLRESGHAHDEAVAANEDREENLLYDFFLADDHLAQLGLNQAGRLAHAVRQSDVIH